MYKNLMMSMGKRITWVSLDQFSVFLYVILKSQSTIFRKTKCESFILRVQG